MKSKKPSLTIAIYLSTLHEKLKNTLSKAVLALIYYTLIYPVGKLVYLFVPNPKRQSDFKKSTQSVFVSRNTQYSKDHLKHPY